MFPHGAQLRASRGLYDHQGIYDATTGTVIHNDKGTIRRTSLAEFQGSAPQIHATPTRSPIDTVERASSQIGAQGYNLLSNNCETFATWAATGQPDSQQVRGGAAIAAGALLGGPVGIGFAALGLLAGRGIKIKLGGGAPWTLKLK